MKSGLKYHRDDVCGQRQEKSGTGLILHHGEALETIASQTSKILVLTLGTTPTNHKRYTMQTENYCQEISSRL
jgi:hypothetical protein